MADPGGGARALADAIGAQALACYVAGLLVVVAAAWGVTRVGMAPRGAAVDRTRRPIALAVILCACVAFLLMTDGIGDGRTIGAFDAALAAAFARHRSAIFAPFALVTHLADRATLIALTIVVAVLLAARRDWRLAAGWALGCAGNGLLNPALKHVFERARPVHDAAFATVGVYSFPSGHSSGAVVCYGLLAYVAIRQAPRRWHATIAAVAAGLVFTIGFSRVLLQVHWASDVVAGLASGTAWLTLCVLTLEATMAPDGPRRSRSPGIG